MQKTEILVLEIISVYTIEPIVRQVNDHKKTVDRVLCIAVF